MRNRAQALEWVALPLTIRDDWRHLPIIVEVELDPNLVLAPFHLTSPLKRKSLEADLLIYRRSICLAIIIN
jgi:hypothetical protein